MNTKAITMSGCFLLCLLALACDAKPKPAPTASPQAVALKCPVCGTEFPRDRVVIVHDPSGDVLLCSKGCAIRYSVEKLPPAEPLSSAAESAETQSDEDR